MAGAPTERMTAVFGPPEYRGVRVVDSFDALLATPLGGEVSAVCWRRVLAGDFEEVVASVAAHDAVTALDADLLASLRLGAAGRAAVDTLLDDLRRLRELGHDPSLECIRGYARDDAGRAVRTDVYSFHVDRADVPTETFLCSYNAPASEGLRHDEARRHVDVPATRARLLTEFGGADDAAFCTWLREHNYDLHYAPTAAARPFSFGVGNLWRLAVEHPGSAGPACIHRAPDDRGGGLPRLLLIS